MAEIIDETDDFFVEADEKEFLEITYNNEIDRSKKRYFQDELNRLKHKDDFFGDKVYDENFDLFFDYGKLKGELEGLIEYFKKY